MTRISTAILTILLLTAGCGSLEAETITVSDRGGTVPETVPETTTSALGPSTAPPSTVEFDPELAAEGDPYHVFLSLAPVGGAVGMTADDASARALLGCGTTWPPGSVDAALAEAYATFIEDWKADGLCG